MSHYTPTTNEVRTGFAVDEFGYWFEDGQGAEFDRWLTAHDAEVTAQAVAAERQAIAGLVTRRSGHYAFHPEGPVASMALHELAQAIRNGEHLR